MPAFDQRGGGVGALDPARLRAWAIWERRFGIVSSMPRLTSMFSSAYGAPP